MKNILILISFLTITTLTFGQGIKKTTAKQSQSKQVESVAKSVQQSDTAKVIVTLLVEDGSITWHKGYVITSYNLPNGFASPATVQSLVDENFKAFAVKADDIYDVKKTNDARKTW